MKNSPETLLKRNQLKKFYKDTIDPTSFLHEIVKKCKDCKKKKPCKWQSSFTQTGIPEYRARCNDCHNDWCASLSKSPHRKKSRNAKKRENIKKKKQHGVARLGGKCKVCGYDKCLAALTFHHREPEHKEFSLGQLYEYSLEKFNKELDKCDLLCFNCHMELHSLEEND